MAHLDINCSSVDAQVWDQVFDSLLNVRMPEVNSALLGELRARLESILQCKARQVKPALARQTIMILEEVV